YNYIIQVSNLSAADDISARTLHDALPISSPASVRSITAHRYRAASSTNIQFPGILPPARRRVVVANVRVRGRPVEQRPSATTPRSEEHTSELQSRENIVCRPLLEKKKHS